MSHFVKQKLFRQYVKTPVVPLQYAPPETDQFGQCREPFQFQHGGGLGPWALADGVVARGLEGQEEREERKRSERLERKLEHVTSVLDRLVDRLEREVEPSEEQQLHTNDE